MEVRGASAARRHRARDDVRGALKRRASGRAGGGLTMMATAAKE
jgi:hypothetical protein